MGEIFDYMCKRKNLALFTARRLFNLAAVVLVGFEPLLRCQNVTNNLVSQMLLLLTSYYQVLVSIY